MKKRRISITILVFDAGFRGGKTKAMIELATTLAPTMDVTLVSLREPRHLHYKLPIKVKFHYVSELGDKKSETAYPIYSFKVTKNMERKLSDFFKTIATDILYLPNYDSALYYQIKLFVPKQTKIIIGDHAGQRYANLETINNDYFHRHLNDRYIAFAASAFDAVHLINPLIEKYYNQVARRTFVIPNTVSCRPSLSWFRRKKHIIMVGRLDHTKEQRFGIEAFSRIAAKHEEWELHLYGDGPNRQELEKQSEEMNCANRIRFHGHQKNMESIYKKASIYLSTAAFESFGLTYIEAMRFSLPIVSFDGPIGAKYLLGDDRGKLVSQGNVDELASSLSQTIASLESKALGYQEQIKINLKYSEQFLPRNICEQWEQEINSLLDVSGN